MQSLTGEPKWNDKKQMNDLTELVANRGLPFARESGKLL